MIENTAANDAAANDQHLHLALHRVGFAAIAFNELLNESSASSKTAAATTGSDCARIFRRDTGLGPNVS
jgi:hypothetical protein